MTDVNSMGGQMARAIYTIQHTASGSHHLKKLGATLGFFKTHDDALQGLLRGVDPRHYIKHYDEHGDFIPEWQAEEEK